MGLGETKAKAKKMGRGKPTGPGAKDPGKGAKSDKPKRHRKYAGWEEKAHKDKKKAKPTPTQPAATPSKKKSKKKLPKLSKEEYQAFVEETAVIASAPGERQLEWLWSQYQRATQASPLEKDGLSSECFQPMASGSLQQQIQQAIPDWKQSLCAEGAELEKLRSGAPKVLLISASAPESFKLIKAIPALDKKIKVAKLFAKHFKVEEQVEYLKTKAVGTATGTPNRLLRLADDGALILDQLRLVALDVRLDVKKNTVCSMPETATDLWAFLARHVLQRARDGQLKIGLFNSAPQTE